MNRKDLEAVALKQLATPDHVGSWAIQFPASSRDGAGWVSLSDCEPVWCDRGDRWDSLIKHGWASMPVPCLPYAEVCESMSAARRRGEDADDPILQSFGVDPDAPRNWVEAYHDPLGLEENEWFEVSEDDLKVRDVNWNDPR